MRRKIAKKVKNVKQSTNEIQIMQKLYSKHPKIFKKKRQHLLNTKNGVQCKERKINANTHKKMQKRSHLLKMLQVQKIKNE